MRQEADLLAKQFKDMFPDNKIPFVVIVSDTIYEDERCDEMGKYFIQFIFPGKTCDELKECAFVTADLDILSNESLRKVYFEQINYSMKKLRAKNKKEKDRLRKEFNNK